MKCLKSILLGSLSAAILSAPALAQTCTPGDELISENTYEVLRKGKSIGEHVISFYGSPEAMMIKARTEMKVDVLFITAFKYIYESDEVYCGGTLTSVNTYVDNNGKERTVPASLTPDGFLVGSKEGEKLYPAPMVTSNHWNKSTDASSILNTANGMMDTVTIAEFFPKDQSDTIIYEVRGTIEYDTYYDAENNWKGMRFEHPKGGLIEFRCIDCTNTPSLSPAGTQIPARTVSAPINQ